MREFEETCACGKNKSCQCDTWRAIYLHQTDDEQISKGGFKSSIEAWKYAETFFCNRCRDNEDIDLKCVKEWLIERE